MCPGYDLVLFYDFVCFSGLDKRQVVSLAQLIPSRCLGLVWCYTVPSILVLALLVALPCMTSTPKHKSILAV